MNDPICTCGHPLSAHRQHAIDDRLVCIRETMARPPYVTRAMRHHGVASTFNFLSICPCECFVAEAVAEVAA